jgi:hypothetical protein
MIPFPRQPVPPAEPDVDYIVCWLGNSMLLVRPTTLDAMEHLKGHVDEDAQRWAGGIAVRPRFIADLIVALKARGWRVQTWGAADARGVWRRLIARPAEHNKVRRYTEEMRCDLGIVRKLDTRKIVEGMEEGFGRKLSVEEIRLSLDQARSVGVLK